MKNYLDNRRSIEIEQVVLSRCFWLLNMTFVQICANMFLRVISADKSGWLREGLKRQLISDSFIIKKTNLVMNMLMIVLVVIVMFSALSIIFYRNIQLRSDLVEVGIYRVLGYDKRKIFCRCVTRPVVDIVIMFPISVVSSIVIWNKLNENEEMSFMIKMMNNSSYIDVLSFVLSICFILLVTTIHTKIFLERSLKKGIRYMLGQGVK